MAEHVSPCASLEKGLSCTPCEELSSIDQEILVAEEFLATLKLKRKEICRRRNNVHDSLTSRLTPEVVSRIFIKFLPFSVSRSYTSNVNRRRPENYRLEGQPTTMPFILGSVSARWRAIAWSTPQLWTSISIDMTYTSDALHSLLREWLGRSGSLSLYIYIYATGFRPECPQWMSDLLAEYASRWFFLRIDVQSSSLQCLNSGIACAPRLSILDIRKSDTNVAIDLGSIPNLKTIRMDLFSISRLPHVEWKKLTHIDVTFQSVDDIYQLFLNATFLVYCSANLLERNKANINTAAHSTILQHDHLEFLHIKSWTSSMDAVLSWMKFPALQHIVALEQCSSLYALISRSSCPLKTLELHVDNRAIHQEELISLLTNLPSLVTVRLKDGSCRRQDIGYCIDPLVSRLSESVRCAGTQSFLPHLKTLDICTSVHFSWSGLLNLLLTHSNDPVRPLETLTIQLLNFGRSGRISAPDSNTLQMLRSAAEDTKLRINITIASKNVTLPFGEFLRVVFKSDIS